MKKLIIFCAALFGVVSGADAQFRFSTNATAGIVVTTENDETTFECNFNTDKALTVVGGAAQKAQTQRGVYSKVYNELGAEVSPQDSRCNTVTGNGNPMHISDIATVLEYYTKAGEPAFSGEHKFWKPVNGVFDVNPEDLTNQAFGTYPGMYKRIDYRFYIDLTGKAVTSDITFDIITFDKGNLPLKNNEAQPAAYKLMVSFGSDKTSINPDDGKTPDYTIENFYITNDNSKSVKLSEVLNGVPGMFSNKKVYIALYTDGTGNAINPFEYDPTIVFDNFKVSYKEPKWIEPEAAANAIVNNEENPVKGKIGEKDQYGLSLKTFARPGAFKITNNYNANEQSYYSRRFSFLGTGAIKGNDGNGNYTVDIPYVLTPATQDDNGNMSQEYITIAAPADGVPVNDDFILFVEATLNSETADRGRIELDCGVRIYYDFYIAGTNASSIDGNTPAEANIYSKNGKIYADNVYESITILNTSGQVVATSDAVAEGIAVNAGVYLVKIGKNSNATKIVVK